MHSKDKKTSPITIIGAGVSGITTGVVLQLLGYHTQIVAKDRADQPIHPDDPEFASLYPSASVIPHSVFGDDLMDYFHDTQKVFEFLLAQGVDGLSLNRHYEVFEQENKIPDYLSLMNNVSYLPDDWQTVPGVPHLSETEYLEGWSFDCLFADWPLYMPQLYLWYKQLGGHIEIRKLRRSDLEELSFPVINCSGLAGRHLFGDTRANIVLKGDLVHINEAPPIRNKRGQTISYNYHPAASRYADAEGNAQDVYCYPRNDGWVMGGSRLEGTIDDHGTWKGTAPNADYITVDGVNIPAPVLDLNRAIIKNSYHVDLNDFTNRSVTTGFRYIRNRDEGLLVARDSLKDRTIIHNYGHGGAGVALSWGTAIHVARLLAEEPPADRDQSCQLPLFDQLQATIRSMLV